MSLESSTTQPHRFLFLKKGERIKFFVFCLFKALLSFLFTMLKMQKTNNLVTVHGAEKIPAVKTLVLVLSLGVVVLYTMMSNRYRQEQLFYGILTIFLLAFALYSFVLIPFGSSLRPIHALGWLHRYGEVAFFKHWLQSWVVIYINWIKVYFFCLAELWGQFGIVMLFWTMCNEIFTREEAKRFYHFFIAAGSLSSILGAWMATYLCTLASRKIGGGSGFEVEKKILDKVSQWIGFIGILVVLVLIALYRWINSATIVSAEALQNKRVKNKLSFWESMRYIFSHPYLLAIAVMIIGCALTRNLVDVTYYKYVNIIGRTSVGYAKFMQWQVTFLHAISIFSSFFIIPFVMRLGWKSVAYLAPVVIGLTGVLFFLSSSLSEHAGLNRLLMRSFAINAYQFVGLVGLVEHVLATFAKYSFFDTTKEIAFVGIDPEARRKGKAAIDVVGSRLGKALSSVIHIIIMGVFYAGDDVRKVSHVLLFVFMLILFSWFRSVRYVGKHLSEKDASQVKVSKEQEVES